MLIQIACDDSRVCLWHDELFVSTLAIGLTGVGLAERLADEMIVVDLQLPALVRILQRALEVFCDLLFAELLLNAIDDCHDSLNVAIKDITLLQALESDLTLLRTSFAHAHVLRENGEAFVRDVIHDRGRALV